MKPFEASICIEYTNRCGGFGVLKKTIVLLLSFICLLSTALPAFAGTFFGMQKGDQGDDVVLLQERLGELGYYTGKADGDYGNGTASAVKAFQSRNALKATGTVDVFTKIRIYSNDAIPMPPPPGLETTKVEVYKSYGYSFFKLDLKNNLDKGIDAFDVRIKAFNQYGERVSLWSYNVNVAYAEVESSLKTFQGKEIKAGSKKSMTKSEGFDLYNYENAVNVEVAIVRYHTTDGQTVILPTNQWVWHNGDGTITYPLDDGYVEPIMTDSEKAESGKFMLGVTGATIYEYIAPIYDKPVGHYVIELTPEGIVAAAGLELGDIITKIGEIRITSDEAVPIAKARMEVGKPVPVEYIRLGEMYTTEFIRTE